MKEKDTVYLFPEKATVQESIDILNSLSGLINAKNEIIFSFEKVQSMDLSLVQLALSFMKTLSSKGKELQIKEPLSLEAREAFTLAGLLVKNEESASALERNLRTLIKEHS
ncbi:MAG: hypothetical protein GW949_04580 [Spirochaetales bacterium]|nr:hypothetical protein [Spirochaetales bacterium]